MPQIHTYTGPPEVVVNAYLVEGDDAVVAVDGTLTVSGGRGLRRRFEAIGKPLAGVLVTHAHPDHYAGIVELVGDEPVDVYAIPGVVEAIRYNDVAKSDGARELFGDEWPARRVLPNRTVEAGEPLELAGMRFTAMDLGPGESAHDSVWFLGDDRRIVFAGDEVYNHVHGFLADGMHEQWLGQLAVLERELPADALLYPGHGEPCGVEALAWQAEYIHAYVDAVRRADWSDPERAKAAAIEDILRFLPTEELRLLMELGIEPTAAKLGLLRLPTA